MDDGFFFRKKATVDGMEITSKQKKDKNLWVAIKVVANKLVCATKATRDRLESQAVQQAIYKEHDRKMEELEVPAYLPTQPVCITCLTCPDQSCHAGPNSFQH